MPDSQTPSTARRVALIGFGEAGETFARAPGWQGETRGWDLLPERRAEMADAGVEAAADAAAALTDRAFVLSLVTADQALAGTHPAPPVAVACTRIVLPTSWAVGTYVVPVGSSAGVVSSPTTQR